MNWKEKIEEYCYRYNIPLEYLSDTLYEPKVVPMIRGKAFEFNVMLSLLDVLPKKNWEVEKIPMNAQQGSHDIDVVARHTKTKKEISIECKLAGKGSFRVDQKGDCTIKVKCMRSRTLGAGMVKLLAPKFKISEKQLMVHNDQYLPGDFDVVITSIGNAFYETNKDGFFDWEPSDEGVVFLENLKDEADTSALKDFAFNRMYVAPAHTLSIKGNNGIKCTRRKCSKKTGCGFIPNYPIIKFKKGQKVPMSPWVPIENSQSLFESLLDI